VGGVDRFDIKQSKHRSTVPIQRVLGFVKAETGNRHKGLGSPISPFYHIFPKWDRLSFDQHTVDVITSVMNNIEIALMHGER
jgi:hypothetical protein